MLYLPRACTIPAVLNHIEPNRKQIAHSVFSSVSSKYFPCAMCFSICHLNSGFCAFFALEVFWQERSFGMREREIHWKQNGFPVVNWNEYTGYTTFCVAFQLNGHLIHLIKKKKLNESNICKLIIRESREKYILRPSQFVNYTI